MKASSILTSLFSLTVLADPLEARGTAASYMMTAVDAVTNEPIANINACKSLLYVGGPQCGSPKLRVQTIINFYPKTKELVLHSKVGWQILNILDIINFPVANPYDLYEGLYNTGWVVKPDTDPVPPGEKRWDGEITVRNYKWFGCKNQGGDPGVRLYNDRSFQLTERPDCKEMKIKLTKYERTTSYS